MLIGSIIIFILFKFLDIYVLKLKFNYQNIIYNIIQLLSIVILFIILKNRITILIITGLLTIINFIFYHKEIKSLLKKKNKFKYIYVILIVLLISTIVEIFICNFRTFQSFNYKPLKNQEINYISNQAIEIKNINQDVKNIYIDLNTKEDYDLQIELSDDGNEIYYAVPAREISNKILRSKYLAIYPFGKLQKIKLIFSLQINPSLIKEITFNKKVPLFFNNLRCLIIALILLFIYFFKSKSNLYKTKLKDLKNPQFLIISILIVNILFFSLLGNSSIRPYKTKLDSYNNLVNSFKEGRTYAKDPKNSEEVLSKLKNPYDAVKREEVLISQNYYLWDYAYFKGHYYVYFGVVPALMFYLPFNLMTHQQLPTAFLVYICSLVTISLITLLLYQFVKKYFHKCSVGVFILLDLLAVYATGFEYLLRFPNQYSVPILTGLMFTFLGLILWLGTLKSKRFLKTKMFLGSLSLALVAGCRPQLLMGSFLLIPILIAFYQEHKDKLTKKDYCHYLLSIIIPYLIVALGLMYYNYIRFGSPFDFGANYNLTVDDMTSRVFKLARIPLGIMMYLFNPINFQNVFPYLVENSLSTNYLGITIYESIYGGLIFTTLIYSLSLFLPKFKKVINNKLLYYSAILMVIFAFVILIADTQMGGILGRYLSDFSWLFAFPTIIIILAFENKEFKYKDLFHKILFILVCLALIYQFFYLFVSIADQFKNNNLDFYMYFYYLIQFWL